VHEHLLVQLQGVTNCELDEGQLASWPCSAKPLTTFIVSLVAVSLVFLMFCTARQDAAT
jgi:hypothetical protein